MDATTTGRFRVLGRPHADDELVVARVDAEQPAERFDPVAVPTAGCEADVADLAPGALIDATVSWADGGPRIDEYEVVRRTRYQFLDGMTGVFEAARDAWEVAAAAGDGMNAVTTRDTDGEANGALYVFAEQPGERDLFEEFRTGARPIDPLVERVNEARGPGERAVFVGRPVDEPFVFVYVAFERDGLLARTIRETYADGADGGWLGVD